MRALILSVILMMAGLGLAQAQDCSGQGSERVLSFDSWSFSELTQREIRLGYRLHEDKAVTRLQANLYFKSGADTVAHMAVDWKNDIGLPVTGTQTITLPKPMMRKVFGAEFGSVVLFACTNYMEYLDGGAIIID